MTDCLLIQEQPDGRVGVALHRTGQAFPEAAGEPFFFSSPLDDVAREDLRWYLEDYLQYPHDPAPNIAARIEHRMTKLGTELFEKVFQSGEQNRRLSGGESHPLAA